VTKAMGFNAIRIPIDEVVKDAYNISDFKSGMQGYIYLRGNDAVGKVTLMPYPDSPKTLKMMIWYAGESPDAPKTDEELRYLLSKMVADGNDLVGKGVDIIISVPPSSPQLIDVVKARHDAIVENRDDGGIIGRFRGYRDYDESCDSCTGWSINGLKPSEIAKTREVIANYVLENGTAISNLYDKASRLKYTKVTKPLDFPAILEEYSQYFDDLTGFIKSIVDNEYKGEASNNEIVKALDIDNNFREKLFKTTGESTTYPEAVTVLGAYKELYDFLGKVGESFSKVNTSLSGKGEGVRRYGAIVGLYGSSVNSFVTQFISYLNSEFKHLSDVASGKPIPKPTDENASYVLI
jgi:dimeric dUTPase (all-alpha-NTP-PPase superfamily)